MSDCLEPRKLNSILFDILSSEEIKAKSVALINCTNLIGEGSVYDERMGAGNKGICVTCGGNFLECCGHFGHIELNEPILHPLYIPYIKLLLSLCCGKCHRTLIKDSIAKLYKFQNLSNQSRFKKSLQIVAGYKTCPRCEEPVPQYEIKDDHIEYYYINKKNKLELSTREIENRFGLMIEQDLKLMGVVILPINLIITNLPVLPPAARPAVKSGSDSCDDDLTYKYIDMIKVNNKLGDPGHKANRR